MSNVLSRFFLLLFAVFLILPTTVDAQATSGIGLKPSLIEEGADPGQVLDRSISVTNLSDEEQTYFLFMRDIERVEDGGVPVYAEPGAEKTGFELTEWLELAESEITLLPGEEQEIDLTITVPDDATPGSHFGGVFVSMQPPRLRQVGASVGYEVANIVSIRISGDAVESAQIRSFRTDNLIYGSTDINFFAEVENKGNVLIRPFGPLEITNMMGTKVATLQMNESQGGVFPFTRRNFELNWKDDGPGFGRYEAVLSMVYGEQGRQSTIFSTVSFWILPMDIIGPAALILVVILLVTYFGVRAYIRSTIAAMSGGRRLVRGQRRRGNNSMLLTLVIVMLSVTALFLIILLMLFA